MPVITQTTDNEGFNNHVAFNSMRPQLEREYPHQWIVIHDGQLMGHYDTHDAAREGARKQNLKLAHCLFQKLNATPPIIVSYGA